MPHGNKKSTSTNNKKKKSNRNNNTTTTTKNNNSNHQGSQNTSTNTNPRNYSTSSSGSTRNISSSNTKATFENDPLPTITDFPEWWDTTSNNNNNNSHDHNNKVVYTTIYERYKVATERFKVSLLQKVPSHIYMNNTKTKTNVDEKNDNDNDDDDTTTTTTTSTSTSYPATITVQNLIDAVDYLHEKSQQQQQQQSNNNDKDRDGTEIDETETLETHSSSNDIIRTITIEPELMKDLKTAISFRQRCMKVFYNNQNQNNQSDVGHEHFIQVLCYCWVTLKSIILLNNNTNTNNNMKSNKNKKKMTDDHTTKQQQPSIPTTNQFQPLSMDDVLDGNDDSDDDSSISIDEKASRIRPVLPDEYKELSLDEIIRGDDYFYASMFLYSLDDMMKFVHNIYSMCKQTFRRSMAQLDDLPAHAYIENLIEGAITTNFILQQIIIMEEEINIKFPYLNTVYRLMMFLVHPDIIKSMTDKIQKYIHNKNSRNNTTTTTKKAHKKNDTSAATTTPFTTHDTIAFVGDIAETGFRNPSDTRSKVEPIVRQFCHKWNITNPSLIQDDVTLLTKVGRMEAPLYPEESMSQPFFALMHSMNLKSHNWLASYTYIGNRDRCMIHTIRLLQGLSNVVKKGKPLILKRGFFGKQWDDKRKLAKGITKDLDEFLMGDILPTLLAMCTDGMLSTKLPYEDKLLTFFTVIKSFTSSPEKAIPWSLAFAIHALLTSVFEMQGHNDVEKLGETAKICYNQFIYQIEGLLKICHSSNSNSKHWHQNLFSMYSLRWLVRPVSTSHTEDIQKRAIWNPLCAGLFMGYICFFGNLDGGMAMVDSFAQLRITLHLYNAFLQVGALEVGQIEFMDWLHDTFKNCKAIWEGPIPKKGEFVKRFWISYGTSIQKAQQMADETHKRLRDTTPDGSLFTRTNRNTTIRSQARSEHREMTPINPEDIAQCFRRVCLHDFSNTQDNYHTDLQRSNAKSDARLSLIYKLFVRCNDTMDIVEKEQRILASNFTVIGHKLNMFVETLCDVLEWTPIIDRIVSETPESVKASRRVDGRRVHANSWEASDTNYRRLVVVSFVAEQLLGIMDVSPNIDQMVKYRALPRTAAFIIKLFRDSIDASEIYCFQPIIMEEDDDEDLN